MLILSKMSHYLLELKVVRASSIYYRGGFGGVVPTTEGQPCTQLVDSFLLATLGRRSVRQGNMGKRKNKTKFAAVKRMGPQQDEAQ